MARKVEDALKLLGIEFDPRPRNGWISARCPYHEERNPSWRIRVTQHRYGQHHCWACKAGGTLEGLAMHVLKLSFEEARVWVGNREVVVEQPAPEEIGVRVVGGRRKFKLPDEVIFGRLDQWVTPARQYMQSRSVSSWQVSKWRLGYAIDGRLAGRIVIPVWRNFDEPRNYMARDFTRNPKVPKYRYPSAEESPSFATLFGEQYWPAQHERDIVVIVEGALNALAVERLEEKRFAVVALGGSSIQPIHALKVATFPHQIILTDNDPAGRKAADTLEPMLRGQGCQPWKCWLQSGYDANDLSPEDLRAALWRAARRVRFGTG